MKEKEKEIRKKLSASREWANEKESKGKKR